MSNQTGVRASRNVIQKKVNSKIDDGDRSTTDKDPLNKNEQTRSILKKSTVSFQNEKEVRNEKNLTTTAASMIESKTTKCLQTTIATIKSGNALKVLGARPTGTGSNDSLLENPVVGDVTGHAKSMDLGSIVGDESKARNTNSFHGQKDSRWPNMNQDAQEDSNGQLAQVRRELDELKKRSEDATNTIDTFTKLLEKAINQRDEMRKKFDSMSSQQQELQVRLEYLEKQRKDTIAGLYDVFTKAFGPLAYEPSKFGELIKRHCWHEILAILDAANAKRIDQSAQRKYNAEVLSLVEGIKKIAGVAQDEIKKVAGVAQDEIKKVTGVAQDEIKKVSVTMKDEIKKVAGIAQDEIKKVSVTTKDETKVSITTQDETKLSVTTQDEMKKLLSTTNVKAPPTCGDSNSTVTVKQETSVGTYSVSRRNTLLPNLPPENQISAAPPRPVSTFPFNSGNNASVTKSNYSGNVVSYSVGAQNGNLPAYQRQPGYAYGGYDRSGTIGARAYRGAFYKNRGRPYFVRNYRQRGDAPESKRPRQYDWLDDQETMNSTEAEPY